MLAMEWRLWRGIPVLPLTASVGPQSARDRDRGTPRDATPPTQPGIRVRTNGGSTELGLGGRIRLGKTSDSKLSLRRACWTAGCPDMRQSPVGEPAATAAANFATPRRRSSAKRFLPGSPLPPKIQTQSSTDPRFEGRRQSNGIHRRTGRHARSQATPTGQVRATPPMQSSVPACKPAGDKMPLLIEMILDLGVN